MLNKIGQKISLGMHKIQLHQTRIVYSSDTLFCDPFYDTLFCDHLIHCFVIPFTLFCDPFFRVICSCQAESETVFS